MNELIYLIVSICCFASAFGLIWACSRLMPTPLKPRSGGKEHLTASGDAAGVASSRIGGAS